MLLEGFILLSCLSVFGALIIAAVVDKIWQLNGLRPIKPRSTRLLFVGKRSTHRDRRSESMQ